MFSEMDLVARSVEDMSREVEELLAESTRLHDGYIAADQKEKELRIKSVEIADFRMIVSTVLRCVVTS